MKCLNTGHLAEKRKGEKSTKPRPNLVQTSFKKTPLLPLDQTAENQHDSGKSKTRHALARNNSGKAACEQIQPVIDEDRRAISTKRILLTSSKSTDVMPNVLRRFDPNKVNKEGTNQVFLFVYLSGKRVQFQTGIFVKANQWDVDKRLVKKTCKEFADHNIELRRLEAKITDIMVRIRLKDIPLTPELLQNEYSKPVFGFDFIDFMDRAIKERKNGDIVASTVKQHTAILSKLKKWKPVILSDELNEHMLLSYAKYLKVSLNNNQNCIHGNLKTIKSYINRATEMGLIERGKLIKNPIKEVDGRREFLSDQEYKTMIELYRTNILSESLQGVLRWFLFSCSTGLRISDLRAITMENIYRDLLILAPLKTSGTTGKTIKIPLMKFAMELLKDEGPIHTNNKVFNCISEQNMRKYIKMIAKEHCLITKKISWHCSRHTFATVFLRNNPGDVVTLQKLMGHSNIRQTLVYLHIDTADVSRAMQFQDGY